MSEAKEYLKKVGLIQSPYISQERVIKHLETFANEQAQKQLLIHSVVVPKGTLCDKCYDTDGFYLGTTCPKCKQPFRSVKA